MVLVYLDDVTVSTKQLVFALIPVVGNATVVYCAFRMPQFFGTPTVDVVDLECPIVNVIPAKRAFSAECSKGFCP